MKNLQLSLKTKWFEMTKSGEKTEDYREITPYWANRLLLYRNEIKSKRFWKEMFEIGFGTDFEIKENINLFASLELFNFNVMTLGYPKKGDPERTLVLIHEGIEIGYGNPEWGAEPGKLYFIIKHGKIEDYVEQKTD